MFHKFLMFWLVTLNFTVFSMDLPLQNLRIRGHTYLNSGNYAEAKASFERIFAATQEKTFFHAEAAKILAFIFLQGLGMSTDYQKAFVYAQQGYEISKSLLLQEPKNESLRALYAQLASYIGIIYKDGPNKDNEKALEYLTNSYNASLNIPKMRAANAYYLAEIYDKALGFDTEHEQTMKYLNEAMTLGIKHSQDVFNLAQSYLEKLELKKTVEIEWQNKIRKKIDLDMTDPCSGKPLVELLGIAENSHVKFIIARVLLRNKNNTIGSVFCSANFLIPSIWGLSAFSAFTKFNDEEALALNSKRNTFSDGRPIISVEFFEWDPSEHIFKYLCDDKEFFEEFSGRRIRLFIIAQNYNEPPSRALAMLCLSEMYFLGLGGDKDLQKAHDYIDLIFKNKQYLSEEAKKMARVGLARIRFDLGTANLASNPDLAMHYFQRTALQDDDAIIKIAASAYLEKLYRNQNELQKALFFVNNILKTNVDKKFKLFYLKLKSKLEKELKLQKSANFKKSESLQISTSAATQQGKKEEVKPSAIETSSHGIVALPQESPIGKKIAEKVELEKEKKVESKASAESALPVPSEEEDLFDIDNMVNILKAETLFKHFDRSLADYSRNPRHITYLKDAKNALEKIEVLNIKNETVEVRIAKARKMLNTNLKKQISKEASSPLSKMPSIRTNIDPFNEEMNIPLEFQKIYEEMLNTLAEDPHASGAKPLKSLGNNAWRVHLGHNYRLFYIVTPHFIGILGIEKKGKSTYAKLPEKYMNRLKWYTEIAKLNITQLNKRIETEKNLGHERIVKALIKLKSK